RTFTAGLLTQLAFWCGQASFFLVLALYLQQGRGLSALDAGLVFTIMAVAYVAASAQAPALVLRFGRRLLAVGALVLAAGHGLLLRRWRTSA
ncbi:MAG: MFS transporter, partial [Solirubrobacterales bacterium]|nr:MFS transporter [Solirubrobacterales bacterium]